MKFQDKAHASYALKVAKQMKKAKSGQITRKAKRIARTSVSQENMKEFL